MSKPEFSAQSKDLTSRDFGRLVALERAGKSKRGYLLWRCRCTCGGEKFVESTQLLCGVVSSCGCLAPETASLGNSTHGMSRTPEYMAWAQMWSRCTDIGHKAYPRYKDRKPPEVWRDFAVFYAELGPRPGPEYSLDRIKNHLPYSPGNVRWATLKEQNRNRSSTLWVNYQGEELSLVEACEKAKLDYQKVRSVWNHKKSMVLASQGKFDLLSKEN